jgi:glycosyltransferase involved in cell wall biosynthesis
MVLPLAGAQVPCGHVTAVTAMHLGTAIVATDSAGLHDYLRDGTTAWLCSPHDEAALGRAVEAALTDVARARALAASARVWAAANCTEAQTVAYLQSLLARQFGAGDASGEPTA